MTPPRTNYSIAKELLDAMGADNGCRFEPCKRHHDSLLRLVGMCLSQGLEFTEDQVCTIAYGEETEQANLLDNYASGLELSGCLNQIFDGCRQCKAEVRQ